MTGERRAGQSAHKTKRSYRLSRQKTSRRRRVAPPWRGSAGGLLRTALGQSLRRARRGSPRRRHRARPRPAPCRRRRARGGDILFRLGEGCFDGRVDALFVGRGLDRGAWTTPARPFLIAFLEDRTITGPAWRPLRRCCARTDRASRRSGRRSVRRNCATARPPERPRWSRTARQDVHSRFPASQAWRLCAPDRCGAMTPRRELFVMLRGANA